MGGKAWSKEEIEFVDDNIDRMTVEMISKRLNRSKNAIKIKMSRSNIQGLRSSMDRLTELRIQSMMGVSRYRVRIWERNGLKVRQIGVYRTFDQNELVKFLRKHQDLWDAAKVKDDTLFMGAQWYLEKRQKDKANRKYLWSPVEVSELITLAQHGASIRQISKQTNHSISGVKYKLKWLRERNRDNGDTQRSSGGNSEDAIV